MKQVEYPTGSSPTTLHIRIVWALLELLVQDILILLKSKTWLFELEIGQLAFLVCFEGRLGSKLNTRVVTRWNEAYFETPLRMLLKLRSLRTYTGLVHLRRDHL
jgi:hypothetical protein